MATYIVCKVCNGKISLINEKYNLGECKNCKLIFFIKKLYSRRVRRSVLQVI
jgi:hypothetical protein